MGQVATLILWGVVVGFGTGLLYSLAVPGHRADRLGSFAFWYVIPALVLLLSVWALRSSTERRAGTALLLVSVLASVFVAEAVLRLFPQRVAGFSMTTAVADSVCPGEYRRQPGCLAALEMGVPFDRRSTLDVIEDLEADGVEAWPSIDASHYLDPDNEIELDGRVVIPVSPGVAGVQTVFCNEAGIWVTYVADEYGFNNPAGMHRADEVRIALVGDSFVHGWCVSFEQTLTGRMRERDPTIVGLGLEGSGPLVQLGIEREYLAPIRPAIVVWLFFEGNDLRDFIREASHDLLPRYLDPGFSQGLRGLTASIDAELQDQVSRMRTEEVARAEREQQQRESARRRRASFAGWVRLSELRSRLRKIGRYRQTTDTYDPALFDQVAIRMREDVAGWGGTLLFAYMPSQRRFGDVSAANPHRASILSQVEALGIPVIDLYETLSAHPDPLSLFPFRVESHLTAEGYDLVALALTEGIQAHTAGVKE